MKCFHHLLFLIKVKCRKWIAAILRRRWNQMTRIMLFFFSHWQWIKWVKQKRKLHRKYWFGLFPFILMIMIWTFTAESHKKWCTWEVRGDAFNGDIQLSRDDLKLALLRPDVERQEDNNKPDTFKKFSWLTRIQPCSVRTHEINNQWRAQRWLSWNRECQKSCQWLTFWCQPAAWWCRRWRFCCCPVGAEEKTFRPCLGCLENLWTPV